MRVRMTSPMMMVHMTPRSRMHLPPSPWTLFKQIGTSKGIHRLPGSDVGPALWFLPNQGSGGDGNADFGQLRLSKGPACLSALNSQRYKTKVQPGGAAAKAVVYITENFLEVKNFNDADSYGAPWLH
ncbi:hypothetical protein M9H77_06287 [Catharanthus roseus]|uniref:Uncharacterized protein n=1 Tax=Catharanthus roseus TaxID=4058 RepID=A0ACC0BRN3_CATRO|nr:hypothetical protein M9H77_06287 [Catharanthus roseus]